MSVHARVHRFRWICGHVAFIVSWFSHEILGYFHVWKFFRIILSYPHKSIPWFHFWLSVCAQSNSGLMKEMDSTPMEIVKELELRKCNNDSLNELFFIMLISMFTKMNTIRPIVSAVEVGFRNNNSILYRLCVIRHTVWPILTNVSSSKSEKAIANFLVKLDMCYDYGRPRNNGVQFSLLQIKQTLQYQATSSIF